MSTLFISHSSHDNDLAKAIERRLAEREHHSVFLDLDPEKGIVAGQSWERTLYRKLRACRAVIALCTDHYLRSHWCFAEIALARMEGKHVIALQCDPLAAEAVMPAILSERQLIDLRRRPEEGFARLWRALKALELLGAPGDWDPGEPPYLGLSAYQEQHAPVFFGREDESLAGIELVERGAPGLIVVLGASGSGKSSLVRAGMLPRLRARPEQWLIVDPFRPGRDPLGELTESLVQCYRRHAQQYLAVTGGQEQMRQRLRAGWQAYDSSRATAGDSRRGEAAPLHDERLRRLLELLERLREDPPQPHADRLRDYLQWTLEDLRRICAPPASKSAVPDVTPLVEVAHELLRDCGRRGARLLLVVDQFEELLGQEQAGSEAARFLSLLRASIESEGSPLMALVTMRSDFLGLFQRDPALQGIDFESLSLGSMGIAGMRRVIEMPARLAAIEIEAGLTDRLLQDTETADALPLLSFTLWVMVRDRRDPGRLQLAEYERLGGLQGTISREADAVLAAARREHKEDELRKALLRMARLSEDGSYARQPVDWDDPEIRQVESILKKLVERRVLVSRVEADKRVVEVAHEALFRAWEPLRAWLDNARSELLLRQQLARDAGAWRDSGRRTDHLWRGGRLLQAGELIGMRGAGQTGGLSVEFLRAGFRRRRLQRASLAASIASVVVVLAGFLIYAQLQADQAREERSRALDLARVSIAGQLLEEDPTKAALILLEVEDPDTTRFAARRLSEALNRGLVSAEFRHTGPVYSVDITRDGAHVLTTSGTRAILWQARTGRELRSLQHEATVVDASFDPSGRYIVTRAGTVGEHYFSDGEGGAAWVWDTQTGKRLFALKHEGALTRVAFGPDGRLLVTGWEDGRTEVWDVSAATRRLTLMHPDGLSAVALSREGTLITVSGERAQLWRAETGEPTGVLVHERDVRDAAFSPDGTRVVTVAEDGTYIWDARTGARLHALEHELARMASFSSDGRLLLTASDQQVRVWTALTGAPTFSEPVTHPNLTLATFSPDGSLVITASGHSSRRGYGRPRPDNAVRAWDARSGDARFVAALKQDGAREVMRVAFAPQAGLIVASSAHRVAAGRYETLREDATARLWPVGSRDRRVKHVIDHPAAVSHTSFSADGRRLLTVAGATVRVWDPETAEPVADLEHRDLVVDASFSGDGTLVLSASKDGSARVWDAQTGQERFSAQHPQRVDQARLVAGGRLLATLSGRRLRLWAWESGAAKGGEALFELPDYGGDIEPDSFSRDGKLIAARSERLVQVWDTDRREPRATLRHDGWVRTAAFTSDGGLLVTGADENVLRVWDMRTGEPAHTFAHTSQLQAVALSPDGRTVLTAQDDGTVRILDAITGEDRITLRHGCGLRRAWFIAGGSLAVTASDDAGARSGCDPKVTVWDVASGNARSSVLAAGAAEAVFDADGGLMLTRQDRFGLAEEWQGLASRAHVWDGRTGEKWLVEALGSEQRVRSAAFHPDGSLLATAAGNRVSMWAISGRHLQSAVAAATTLCLAPESRRQSLSESPEQARRKYEVCERGHGRGL